MPLRARLTLWYVLLLGLTLLLFSGSLYLRMQRSLLAQVDSALQAAVAQAVTTIDEEDGRPRFQETEHGQDVERRLSQTGFAVRLVALDGTVWQGFGGDVSLPVQLPLAGGYVTAAGSDGGWRLYTQPLIGDDDRRTGWIQATQSLSQVQQAMTSLRSQALLGLPFVLLLAGGSGFWLANRALRPIDRMTRTAAAIGAHELDRRIGYRGPADEVGRLATTLDQMLERLAAAFARERRFIADASHELRTPLTALKGRIGVTLDRTRPVEEYEIVLRDLAREVDRLIRLSADLLLLARLDQGGLPWQPDRLTLRDLLAAIVEQLRPLATAKRMTLVLESGPDLIVEGAADHLIRLFLNLVDNAIKYTPPGGQVRLRADATGTVARVTISDTGPGIAPEQLPHIFERFYRVAVDRSRDVGGAGLGMAIAYEIARWHRGTIKVESAVGHGTIVTVRLPRK